MARGRRLTLPKIMTLAAICWAAFWLAAAFVNGDDTAVIIEPRLRPPSPDGNANRVASHMRVDSNLVLVPVTVTDRQDQLVMGLERKNFKLFEDRMERPIQQFAFEDAPVSVIVLFDSSGSMRPKQQQARMAVSEFLISANPDDEFALLEFNDRARLIVKFTKEPEKIEDLLRSTIFKGETALLDAICLALNAVKYGVHHRKALFIVSDGGDNHSRYTRSEVRDRVREADVQIYSIAVIGSSRLYKTHEETGGAALLEEMARLSGGHSFEVADLDDLSGLGATVGSYLRSQYMLGFAPAVPARDGKYHRIEVRLAPSSGSSSMRVRFRSGYFAPEP